MALPLVELSASQTGFGFHTRHRRSAGEWMTTGRRIHDAEDVKALHTPEQLSLLNRSKDFNSSVPSLSSKALKAISYFILCLKLKF